MYRSLSTLYFPMPLYFLIPLSLLLLNACTSTSINHSESPVEQSVAQTRDRLPKNWTLSGRISLTTEQENWYAKFIWIQKNQDYQLSFTGPLGATELQISLRGQKVTIKTPSGERSGYDLEQMLSQETGLDLPISSLRYWLQAYPNPNAPAKITHNKHQQITAIEQSQWHIQYPKRIWVKQQSGALLSLPKKIVAKGQDTKIKLIISRWQLGEANFDENANVQ